MGPQFVDFDADGHTDIVTATFEGHAFVVRGSETGWQSPEHIRDAAGNPIAIAIYYDVAANDYRHVGQQEGEKTDHSAEHCVSAVAFDWDADGDHDLLLGSKKGGLHLRLNEGTNAAPAFATANTAVMAGGKPFLVPGGLTAPRLVDWDADGLTDLVCGTFEGGAVHLYRNTGALGAPAFAAPHTLLAAGTGPNEGAYVDVLDHDGDGDLDLVIGGYYHYQPPARALTATEEAEADELEAKLEATSAELDAIWADLFKRMGGLTVEAADALEVELRSSAAFTEIMARLQGQHERLDMLRPSAQRRSGIWLLRQESSASEAAAPEQASAGR